MPELDPARRTANEHFDALWEQVGAKRVIIGDEDKGVEIRVDADLSVFGILEKLKAAADEGHSTGEISDEEQKVVRDTLEDTARKLSGGIHDKLQKQFRKFTGGGL